VQARRDLGRKLLTMHCCAHILALATGDAFDGQPALDIVLKYVRGANKLVCNSVNFKLLIRECDNEVRLQLADLEDLEDVFEVIGWELTYPTYYCATRWKCIYRCLRALCRCSLALFVLRTRFLDKGCGPLVEKLPASLVSGDGEGATLNAYAESLKQAARVNVGDEDCATQRQGILCLFSGHNVLTWSMASMAHEVLLPHQTLTALLQTTGQPVSHLAARWFRKFHNTLTGRFIGEQPLYGAMYSPVRVYLEAADQIVLRDLIDVECVAFATRLRDGVLARLGPYRDFLEAFELIDPTLPNFSPTPQCWTAVEELCSRFHLDYGATKEQLIALHTDMSLPVRVVEECERNLYRVYYRDGGRGFFAAYPHAVEYARVVFTVPVVSVVVESLFSVMNYTKGKHRARHSDEGFAATIHIKECDSVISYGSGPLPDGLHHNQERFLLHDMRDAGFHPPTLPDNLRPVRQRSGPEAD